MLRSLKEVQGDDNVVGFYQATALGAFFNQTLIDTQAIHQERLRHGGVVIVHGDLNLSCWTGKEINGVDRCFANSTRERVVPGVQTDVFVYGRVQEGEFQLDKVGWDTFWSDPWVAYGVQPDDASADVFVDPRGDSAENSDEPAGEGVPADTGCAECVGVHVCAA